jgi:hypothetical protein
MCKKKEQMYGDVFYPVEELVFLDREWTSLEREIHRELNHPLMTWATISAMKRTLSIVRNRNMEWSLVEPRPPNIPAPRLTIQIWPERPAEFGYERITIAQSDLTRRWLELLRTEASFLENAEAKFFPELFEGVPMVPKPAGFYGFLVLSKWAARLLGYARKLHWEGQEGSLDMDAQEAENRYNDLVDRVQQMVSNDVRNRCVVRMASESERGNVFDIIDVRLCQQRFDLDIPDGALAEDVDLYLAEDAGSGVLNGFCFVDKGQAGQWSVWYLCAQGGCGQMLMWQIEEEAQTTGLEAITLTPAVAAVAFYLKLGYDWNAAEGTMRKDL